MTEKLHAMEGDVVTTQSWERAPEIDHTGMVRTLAALLLVVLLPLAMIFPVYTLVGAVLLALGGLSLRPLLALRRARAKATAAETLEFDDRETAALHVGGEQGREAAA